MPEFFLELLSEEIPPRLQAPGAQALAKGIREQCAQMGLPCDEGRAYVTPVRMIFHMEEVSPRARAFRKTLKGPRKGAPQVALEGFLRKHSLEESALSVEKDAKGVEYHCATQNLGGEKAQDLLVRAIIAVLENFSWPRSMRWGSGEFSWIRPLRGIMAVYGGKPLRGSLPLGGESRGGGERLGLGESLAFAKDTRGHRFAAQSRVTPKSFADYRAQLLASGVEIDSALRKKKIASRAESLAKKAGLTLVPDPGLLNELAGLAEAPQVLLGQFDEKFLQLPAEILRASLRVHQRCFSLQKAGKTAPSFVTVADGVQKRVFPSVIAGTTRVLRARLSDGEYLWEQDLAASPSAFREGLAHRQFQEGLGSVADRCTRLSALIEWVYERLYPENLTERTLASKAGEKAKWDLASATVAEFPSLQGIVGMHLARAWKEPESVCQAIGQQYQPQGPEDACPSTPLGVALALAEKLDSLTGFWAVGKKPTGSGDPFALRRAALGILRILMENDLGSLTLQELLAKSLSLYPKTLQQEDIHAQLRAFFRDRMRILLRSQDYPGEVIDSVLPKGLAEDFSPALCLRICQALQAFLAKEEGRACVQALRRAGNIVRQEEEQEKKSWGEQAYKESLLEHPKEKALAESLRLVEEKLSHMEEKLSHSLASQDIASQDIPAALRSLCALGPPLDAFFDHVSVNQAERSELRENRLRLLWQVANVARNLADFSALSGKG